MEYTTIKIPSIAFYFVVGLSGFFGFGAFVATITGNNIYGYIAGIIGFVIIIVTSKDLEKRLIKHYKGLFVTKYR